MNFVYTNHACRRAFFYGISKGEVEQAISEGDSAAGYDDKIVFTDWKTKVTAVVLEVSSNTYLVITAYRELVWEKVAA